MNSIDQVKHQLDEINIRRVQIAAKLKTLEEEKEELLRQCTILNVEPTKIAEVIEEQETLVQAELDEIQKVLKDFHVLSK